MTTRRRWLSTVLAGVTRPIGTLPWHRAVRALTPPPALADALGVAIPRQPSAGPAPAAGRPVR